MPDGLLPLAIACSILVIAIVAAVAWHVSQLAWVPTDYAVVVRRKRCGQEIVRVVLGASYGHTHVRRNPLTERCELLSLSLRTMEVDVPGAATVLEGREVRFTLHLALQYGPVADPALLLRMADSLLDGERSGLDARVREVVGAKAREACRQLTPLRLNSERDGVSQHILDSANEALKVDGLWLRVVMIKDFDDDDGFFEELRRTRATGEL